MIQSRHATDPLHAPPALKNTRSVDPGSDWRAESHRGARRRNRRPPCPRGGSHARSSAPRCRARARASPHDSLELAALAGVHGSRCSSDCPETPAPGLPGVHGERSDRDRQWIRLPCANHANGNELPWRPVFHGRPDPDRRGSAKSRNSIPLESNRGLGSLGCGLLSGGPKSPIGRAGASPADLSHAAPRKGYAIEAR